MLAPPCLLVIAASFLVTGCVRLDVHTLPCCKAEPRQELHLPDLDTRVKELTWDGAALQGRQADQTWSADLPKGVDWKAAHTVKVLTGDWEHEVKIHPERDLAEGAHCGVAVWAEEYSPWSTLSPPYGLCAGCLGIPLVP